MSPNDVLSQEEINDLINCLNENEVDFEILNIPVKEKLLYEIKEIKEQIELSKNTLEYQLGILEGLRIAYKIIKK